jgi:hypothetical protein
MDSIESIESKVVCPEGVLDGCMITKEQRHKDFGVVSGGGGTRAMENYQLKQIEVGTGFPCSKTTTRINQRTHTLVSIAHPMTQEDGFDYTENFDGMQTLPYEKRVWVNLKHVVGKGGSQTRTLRDECYPFVEAQLQMLLKHYSTIPSKYYFANIFDGDEAAAKMKMFKYLLGLEQYKEVQKYVYVGDLKHYFAWFKTVLRL